MKDEEQQEESLKEKRSRRRARREDERNETRANYLSISVMTWKLKAASLVFLVTTFPGTSGYIHVLSVREREI